MKPSKFNLYIPTENGEDHSLVYNTLSDSCVVVDGGTADRLSRGMLDDVADAEKPSQWQPLIPLGIVVEDSVDEDREVEYWFQRLKFNPSVLWITVVVTELCNLGCVYCYEQERRGSDKMDEATADRLIQWIERRLRAGGVNKVHIDFFGGEPLMNLAAVESISSRVSRLSRSRGLDFETGIITNGTLLTEELIARLVPMGLKEVKVTLDGDKADHDRLRPFCSGTGTFQRILENLRSIRGMVPIRIGGNLDAGAIKSVPSLLDALDAYGLKESICSVQFKPIFASKENASTAGTSYACKFDDCENLDDFLALHHLIVERGFPTDTRISLGPCEACSEGNFAVGPCGELYKCAVMAGENDAVIGTIDGVGLNHWNTEFMTMDLWRRPECRDCAFLPICGGGCRYTAKVEGGSWQDVSCNLRYFEKVSVPMIRDLYEPKGGEIS